MASGVNKWGLLWGGAPNQILKLCMNGVVRILESDETLDEVKSVLQYPKFSDRFSALGTDWGQILISDYGFIFNVISWGYIDRANYILIILITNQGLNPIPYE